MMSSGSEQLQCLPPGRGLTWLLDSITLLRAQPYRLLLMGLLLQFIGGFSQVGILGLVFFLAMPAFTAGMLQGLNLADNGLRPSVLALFSAFTAQGRLPRLLLMGLIMLGCAVLASAFTIAGSITELDPQLLERLQAGEIQAIESIDPVVLNGMLLGLLLGILVGGTLSFFAIPLVWFAGKPLGQAILTGLRGMMKNWRPFLVLGLLLGLITIPVALLAGITLLSSRGDSEPSRWLMVIVLLVMVLYQLLLFGTQYVAYRDIFGVESRGSASKTPEDQLVA